MPDAPKTRAWRPFLEVLVELLIFSVLMIELGFLVTGREYE
jgi:hypothetical protein